MNYTNRELYSKCLELSGYIKKYRNQFIALIPLVEKRKVYLKHNMHSIYEFAAKLAGISNETVAKILRISHKLKKSPRLQEAFVNGEVTWTKLEVVSPLISAKNDLVLALKLPTMSVDAIRLMVKELKLPEGENLKSSKKQTELLSVKLSVKTMTKLKIFKAKVEKRLGHLVTWDKAFSMMLEDFYQIYPTETIHNSKDIPLEPRSEQPRWPQAPEAVAEYSRYIPAKKRREILSRTNGLCSKCNKPAQVLHHEDPYSVSYSHESVVPLCRAHHDLVHHENRVGVNLKYQSYKKSHKKLVTIVEKQAPDNNYYNRNRKPEVVVVDHALHEG
jgi:hypothetical protein